MAAICLTAFMQTTLLFLGLLTFPGNMLLGLGIMLAANEVPRIAQQFGLDFGTSQHDERCSRYHHGGQPDPHRGKGGEVNADFLLNLTHTS